MVMKAKKSPEERLWDNLRATEKASMENPAAPVQQPGSEAVTPPVNLVGIANVGGTHKVTIGFTATSVGINFMVLSPEEARATAETLHVWANFVDQVER